MSQGTKSEGFALVRDHLLQILHITLVDKARINTAGEIIEGKETIGIPRRTESECVTMVANRLLEVLHITASVKASGNG
jgi:hypothetical protein